MVAHACHHTKAAPPIELDSGVPCGIGRGYVWPPQTFGTGAEPCDGTV